MPHSPKVVCVLEEPTEEMAKAGIRARQKHGNTVEGIYRAMLAASPGGYVAVPVDLLERLFAEPISYNNRTSSATDQAYCDKQTIKTLLLAAQKMERK